MRPLPRLQFLTLDACPIPHARQAELACAGGVRWVQLRAKGRDFPAWLALAREVVSVCREHGALCTVNDSPEVALDAAADGVHLGRADAAPAAARARLGHGALIGVTLNAAADLARLGAGAPDYAGIGPFRATLTKRGHAPVHTADSLRALALGARVPAYAIGGVAAADLAGLRALGASGAAVSAAIALAASPRDAARALVEAAAAAWEGA